MMSFKVIIFFFYGLAFFTMGFAIFLYPRKRSAFELAKSIWLVGTFGVLHGANEWVDMFMLLQAPHPAPLLKIVGFVLLPVSYIFLLQFGMQTIAVTNKLYKHGRTVLVLVLVLTWAIIVVLSDQRFLMGGIWARYLIGFPGITLTATALFLQGRTFRTHHLPTITNHLLLSAVAFFSYGILSGLVVPKADFFPASLINYTTFFDIAYLPVQFFRSICAIVITYGIIRVLGIFEWETKIKIMDANEHLQREIEERILTEKALKKQTKFLQVIIESVTQPFYVIDVNTYRIVMANKASNLGALSKYSTCYAVTHHRDKPCDGDHVCPLEMVKATKKAVTVEHIHYDKNGNQGFFEVHGYPVFDEDGNIVQMIEYAQDITERKRNEEALSNAHRELEEKNEKLKRFDELKSGFVANVAHEVRNPLAGIKGALHLISVMMKDQLSDKQKHVLDMGDRTVDRLNRLVTDLLDLSKIETGKMQLNWDKVDITSLIEEVLLPYDAQLSKKNITLEKNISPDGGFLIADRDKLSQVFINLLNNAIKYTQSGGTVAINVIASGSELRCEICDNGPGIPEGECKKIFDKFERVTAEKQEGTGLGLAIAKDIVDLHKGKMWVESEIGKGSTFIFTLPRG